MSGHGHAPEGGSKKTALLIALIALLLSFSEHFGNNAQNGATAKNIEASNLWSFFQAKNGRRTMLQAMNDSFDVSSVGATPEAKEAIAKRIEANKKIMDRLESEPETGEGRKELSVKAKKAESDRDLLLIKKEHYEIATGLFQIAIVIASTAIITGLAWMVYLTGFLGVFGFALMVLGAKFPMILAPLFH
jgi:Domain of unknown function (DUF4337)